MMIHGLHRSRPARIASVLAVLVIVWIWFSDIQGVRLADDFLPSYQRATAGWRTSTPSARVGKVSVAANKLDSDVIHRALLTHERHNALHGYPHYIAMHEAVSGLIENDRYHRPKGAWTKPAYLLAIIVAELEKDEDERLEWIYWFDADTVILNYETPLELFLPPKNATNLNNVDLLITSNWDGLNSGVFALRVSPWSVSLLSAVLAYPIYEAERMAKDRFRDQSAFQYLLEGNDSPLADTPMKGRDHWIQVPMRWFNALPVNNAFFRNGTWVFGRNMTKALFDNGTTDLFEDGHSRKVNPWKVMQGDLVVHFAGTSNVRDSWMAPWVERAEAGLPEWNNATTKVTLKQEVDEFWEEMDAKMLVDRAEAELKDAQEFRDAKEKKAKADKLEEEEKKKAQAERVERVRLAQEKMLAEKEKQLEKEILEKQMAEQGAVDADKKATAGSAKSGIATPPNSNSTLHSNNTTTTTTAISNSKGTTLSR